MSSTPLGTGAGPVVPVYHARVRPIAEPLAMYGRPSELRPPEWEWVQEQLTDAGTYWVVARAARRPHPRPVWGIWDADALHLSVGSPAVTRALRDDPLVTVHLDSGTDVVIVEGTVTGSHDDAALLARYDAKYEWHYTVDEYGPLTTVAAEVVVAWRSAGWAGRDGFQEAGRWRFVG